MRSDSVTVLGLDPGLATFGASAIRYVANRPAKLISTSTFMSDASAQKRGVAKSDDRFRRTRDLFSWLDRTIATVDPDLIAVEAMSFPRGSNAIAAIALAWGAIASATRGLAVVQVHPKSWRRHLVDDGTEESAHAAIESLLGNGFDHRKGWRVHQLDAAGMALWARSTDEFMAIRKGRDS